MERYLTIDEAAAQCRTSARTLRWWANHGNGPHSVKRGRRRLYPQSCVEHWLKTGERGPDPSGSPAGTPVPNGSEVDAHIRYLVEQAPPLTEQQRSALTAYVQRLRTEQAESGTAA